MAMRHGSYVNLALVPGLVVLAGLYGALDASGNEGGAEGIPKPIIAPGEGDSCVDDPDYLRRYHMVLLQQEHDKAEETGMRGERDRLRECVTCHAARDSDGSVVTAESPQHFCRSCHDYTAVEIDCFECHRSRWRRR